MDEARRRLLVALAGALIGAPRVARAQAGPLEAESAAEAHAGGGWIRRALLAGTRFETAIHELDTGAAGPKVLVVGGVHGNEPAGAAAADSLLGAAWAFKRGRLWVVPRANQPALRANERHTPSSRHPDLNRNFPTQKNTAPRGQLARALWNQVEALELDWLLDLHEGFAVNRQDRRSVGSSVIHTGPETRDLGRRLQSAVNATIEEESKHFTLLTPPKPGSLARSAAEALGVRGLILETTRVGQPLELRVAQHHTLLLRFFVEQRML